jgi:hypothetical protein
MTVRQTILEAIRDDMLTITEDNGFNGTIKTVFHRFHDLSSIKESDLTAVHITPMPASATMVENLQAWSWDIAFIIYFSVARDAGDELLTETQAENYIEDVSQRFLNPTNTISIDSVESVTVSMVDTYPMEEQNTIGIVYGTITITYLN